mgnify:CR=1 FL=1
MGNLYIVHTGSIPYETSSSLWLHTHTIPTGSYSDQPIIYDTITDDYITGSSGEVDLQYFIKYSCLKTNIPISNVYFKLFE